MALFCELCGQKADVFKTVIIPEVHTKRAKDFYDAFRLKSPDAVRRTEIGLVYEFDDGDSSRQTRNPAFARRPVIADEIIEDRRKKKNAPETVPEGGKRPSERFEKQEDYGTRSGRGKPAGKEKKDAGVRHALKISRKPVRTQEDLQIPENLKPVRNHWNNNKNMAPNRSAQ